MGETREVEGFEDGYLRGPGLIFKVVRIRDFRWRREDHLLV